MNIAIIDETAFIGIISILAGTLLAVKVRVKKNRR